MGRGTGRRQVGLPHGGSRKRTVLSAFVFLVASVNGWLGEPALPVAHVSTNPKHGVGADGQPAKPDTGADASRLGKKRRRAAALQIYFGLRFTAPPAWLRVLNLFIDEIAFGGRGVGRLEDGRVVFVPFVAPGETVRVEIVREHKSYLEARLLAVDDPSPRRVPPPCPYFGRCGGCSYQHLDAQEQADLKQRQVGQVLRRVGKFESPNVLPLVPSPQAYGYRNRITVHVRGGVIGFYSVEEGGARGLIDIAQCPIAEPAVNEALGRFRSRPRPREGHCTLRGDAGGHRAFRQTNDAAADALLALVAGLLPTAPPATHLIDALRRSGDSSPATCATDSSRWSDWNGTAGPSKKPARMPHRTSVISAATWRRSCRANWPVRPATGPCSSWTRRPKGCPRRFAARCSKRRWRA